MVETTTHLIKNIKTKFSALVEKLQKYQTPGTPGNGVFRPQERAKGNTKVLTEDQEMYQSGVGMLLYLVKHLRPNIANVNVVRELSKVMDGATPATLKELKRVMKIVLDTRTFGLKIKPKKIDHIDKWDMVIDTYSNYAGCIRTLVSV
jgi:hypothetical protein